MPHNWTVAEQTEEYVMLRDAASDDKRRLVVVDHSSDDLPPDVEVVYPCGTCGWSGDCAEGCHT